MTWPMQTEGKGEIEKDSRAIHFCRITKTVIRQLTTELIKKIKYFKKILKITLIL